MSDETRTQLRAILTRAADAEASRQRAVQDKDWQTVAALEAELAKLYREHAEVEREQVA